MADDFASCNVWDSFMGSAMSMTPTTVPFCYIWFWSSQERGGRACSGGEAEGQAAYDEAVTAVFDLQLECHRHTQPHKSKKDGTTKWAMIEMWPMLVIFVFLKTGLS